MIHRIWQGVRSGNIDIASSYADPRFVDILAFSLYSTAAEFGIFCGHFIGGTFSNIVDKVRWTRNLPSMGRYPYLLPNLSVSTMCVKEHYERRNRTDISLLCHRCCIGAYLFEKHLPSVSDRQQTWILYHLSILGCQQTVAAATKTGPSGPGRKEQGYGVLLRDRSAQIILALSFRETSLMFQ